MDLLKYIVDATNSPAEMTYCSAGTIGLKELEQAGYVEINYLMKDSNGKIAVRATEKGLEKGTLMSNGLKIENISVTKGPRKAFARSPKYPELRQLEIGQSVVINGITMKQATSIINAVQRVFSVVTGQAERKGKTIETRRYDRRFAAIEAEGGVRIGRIALTAENANGEDNGDE